MFCPYCGQQIAADSVFCRYCGKKIDADPQATSASTSIPASTSNAPPAAQPTPATAPQPINTSSPQPRKNTKPQHPSSSQVTSVDAEVTTHTTNTQSTHNKVPDQQSLATKSENASSQSTPTAPKPAPSGAPQSHASTPPSTPTHPVAATSLDAYRSSATVTKERSSTPLIIFGSLAVVAIVAVIVFFQMNRGSSTTVTINVGDPTPTVQQPSISTSDLLGIWQKTGGDIEYGVNLDGLSEGETIEFTPDRLNFGSDSFTYVREDPTHIRVNSMVTRRYLINVTGDTLTFDTMGNPNNHYIFMRPDAIPTSTPLPTATPTATLPPFSIVPFSLSMEDADNDLIRGSLKLALLNTSDKWLTLPPLKIEANTVRSRRGHSTKRRNIW